MKFSIKSRSFWAASGVVLSLVTAATLFQNCADQGFQTKSLSETSDKDPNKDPSSKDKLDPGKPILLNNLPKFSAAA